MHARCKSGVCRAGLVFALMTSLAACSQSGSGRDPLPMSRASALVNGAIRVGMSRADVIDKIGTPHRTETNGSMEFLFYDVIWMMKPTAGSANPIAIQGGKVVGTGASFYNENRGQNSN